MADVTKIKLPDNSEYNIKDYRIPGVDTTPTSGSDNVVTSGGVYDKINDESLVISTALNDLNDRLSEIEGESDYVSNNDYEEDQEVIARAINDLNNRVTQNTYTLDSIPTENSTNLVTSGGVYNTIVENELATASAINEINDRLSEVDNLISEIEFEETDPVFSASPAANITTSDITNWNNKTNNTGTVTQVNVGSTSYNPSNGVVSLPAYPTTLPASDVSAWAKANTKPTYTASEVGAQETLVSGTNIKTINNESLLGSGNITVTSGKGIESITTTQNGEIVITLENNNTITIDLNHSHSQYIKYQYLDSETDYSAIQNKDSNTLYLILES